MLGIAQINALLLTKIGAALSPALPAGMPLTTKHALALKAPENKT